MKRNLQELARLLREQAEGVRINAKYLNEITRRRQLQDSSKLMIEAADELIGYEGSFDPNEDKEREST